MIVAEYVFQIQRYIVIFLKFVFDKIKAWFW